MTKTKLIGYSLILAGAIATLVGGAHLVSKDFADTVTVGLGLVGGGAGYWLKSRG